jgi:hypothetical protein
LTDSRLTRMNGLHCSSSRMVDGIVGNGGS